MDGGKMQNFQILNEWVEEAFQKSKKEMRKKLKFSWSNWGFGMEKLQDSLERLEKNGISYIELHGNHYTKDIGYNVTETKKMCEDYGIKVSGICGMFSRENDLSSNSAWQRQNALDYIRREVEFCSAIGGDYLLIVPGAVGRPDKYDDSEYERSLETLRIVGDIFEKYHVRGAIEPIRSAEVSLIHTFEEAKRYIQDLNCPWIEFINGDIYHMQSEEVHIGKTILDGKDYLYNLHLADSNRRALGKGSMDIDIIIKALYAINYQGYVTAEPLGPGGNPYPAMNGKHDSRELDDLVEETVNYFRSRENML